MRDRKEGTILLVVLKKIKKWTFKHDVIVILVNIEIFRLFRQFVLKFFKHNQQYDTLLPVIPCAYKLKAGIACWNRPYIRL